MDTAHAIDGPPASTHPHRAGAGFGVAGRLPWRWTRDGPCLAFLAAAFLVAVAFVGPGGEFPLNDDWSFAGSVRQLVATHDWRPLGWASMTQVSHAAIGALVCSLESCTFEHLRAATLLAGAALGLSCFALCRRAGSPRLQATVAAAAATLNPVLFPLMFTFMTDVPFALLAVGSAAASADLLRTGRWRSVVAAAALVTAATLSRQLGIALAVALLPLYAAVARERIGVRLCKAALPLAVSLAALLAYEGWMRRTDRLPALYDAKYGELAASLAHPLHLAAHGAVQALLCCLYLGAVCLPVLLLRPLGARAFRGVPALGASAVSLALLLRMAHRGAVLPQLGNVLNPSGVGPLTLRDTYVLGLHDVPDLPLAFWLGATGLALAGCWLLVHRALAIVLAAGAEVRRGGLRPEMAVRLYGLGAPTLLLLPLLSGDLFDRYVIGVAPVLMLALVPAIPSSGEPRTVLARRGLACATAAALALVAVLATHDYMAWNRARWGAIADIEAAHEADAATLDGGFEYNGLRSYDPAYVATPARSWWWVGDDRVQIAFGPVPGTVVERRYPYRTWMLPGARSLLVLRRAPSDAGP